jgi:hypothetical protein
MKTHHNLLGFLYLLLGAALGYLWVTTVDFRYPDYWVETAGRVTSFNVTPIQRVLSNGTRITEYRPIVQYEYSFGRTLFQGQFQLVSERNLDFSLPGDSPVGQSLEATQELSRQYRPRTAVDIVFNPANPSESRRRIPSSSQHNVFLKLFTALWVFCGIIYLGFLVAVHPGANRSTGHSRLIRLNVVESQTLIGKEHPNFSHKLVLFFAVFPLILSFGAVKGHPLAALATAGGLYLVFAHGHPRELSWTEVGGLIFNMLVFALALGVNS